MSYKWPKKFLLKVTFKSPTVAGIAMPGTPHGSLGMKVHNHESYSHGYYKSYQVFSFGEDINEELFDTVTSLQ